jgi:DNA-binding IclR family transcriptional regulator
MYSSNFGIRKIEYEVADSPYLTISVNGVKIMVRGGDWGLDEAMKRVSRTRLEPQFRMHAQANLNMIRNWVGQSTSPDFYDLADRYGLMLWDEFFQPNPNDGPDVADTDTYLANVTDKFDPRDRASAPLRRLVGEFGEVGYLCALRGGSIVLLDPGLPSRDMAGLPRTGSTAPVLSTAAGRAILAFSSPETAQHLLTSASVSGGEDRCRTSLHGELVEVRRTGYAIGDDGWMQGYRAVAAPILGSLGEAIAALKIAGPSFRMTAEKIENIGRRLVTEATYISQEIGCWMPD